MTAKAGKQQVSVRRVYEPVSAEDGARVLVDRVWPRGVAKEAAKLDEWLRDIAPSTDLRKWYAHDPAKFAEFRRRYRDELRRPPQREQLTGLQTLVEQGPVTLLTATKDVEHSQAAVLAELLSA